MKGLALWQGSVAGVNGCYRSFVLFFRTSREFVYYAKCHFISQSTVTRSLKSRLGFNHESLGP